MSGTGFSVLAEHKDGLLGDTGKERLARCYAASVSWQVFTPAFESLVLFINRTRDLAKAAFSRRDRANACGKRIPARL